MDFRDFKSFNREFTPITRLTESTEHAKLRSGAKEEFGYASKGEGDYLPIKKNATHEVHAGGGRGGATYSGRHKPVGNASRTDHSHTTIDHPEDGGSPNKADIHRQVTKQNPHLAVDHQKALTQIIHHDVKENY